MVEESDDTLLEAFKILKLADDSIKIGSKRFIKLQNEMKIAK